MESNDSSVEVARMRKEECRTPMPWLIGSRYRKSMPAMKPELLVFGEHCQRNLRAAEHAPAYAKASKYADGCRAVQCIEESGEVQACDLPSRLAA